MDQAEVTNAEFARFVDATHYVTTAEQKPAHSAERDADIRDALQRASLLREVETARSRYGRLLRTQLENQQRELAAKSARTPAEDAAYALLKTELEDVAKTDRFPFIGRVPAPVAAVLEPYRGRLQSTLPEEPAEIALDLFRASKGRRGGFQVDFDDGADRRSRTAK